MSRAAAQPAYVLHQWDWSETSLIVELFTREQGRVAVAAKGAKRPYSQLRAVLLPFQRIAVTLGRPKADDSAEILTLRGAEFVGPLAALPPARLYGGFYLNELVMKLLARLDPHPRLFDAYASALLALATLDDDEWPLRAFELVLLREIGLLPDLGCVTATQQPVDAAREYALSPQAGLVVAAAGEPGLSGAQARALQAALDAQDFGLLCRAVPPAAAVLKAQLRAQLHYHLGTTRLRSRQAIVDVRRLLDSSHPQGSR